MGKKELDRRKHEKQKEIREIYILKISENPHIPEIHASKFQKIC